MGEPRSTVNLMPGCKNDPGGTKICRRATASPSRSIRSTLIAICPVSHLPFMVVRQTIFDPASWRALKLSLRHGAYVSGRPCCCPRAGISASEKFSVAGTSPNGTSCCASTLITVVAMNTTNDPVASNRYRADLADEYGSRMSINQFLSWMFGQEFADKRRPELYGIGRVYQKMAVRSKIG